MSMGGVAVITAHRLFASGVALTALALTGPATALTIDFDFSFDDDDDFFFQQDRQTLLQAAGDYVGNRLNDSLTAIISGGGNTFEPNFSDPDASDGKRQLGARSISENTLVIFTGGRDLAGDAAGLGGPGGFNASATSATSQEWLDNAGSRGQAGALDSPPTDFGPWGGAIWFDTDTTWHFDADPFSVEGFAGLDFFSVAIHEIAHVLGFGIAPSWDFHVDESGSKPKFTGPVATSVHGADVPLQVITDQNGNTRTGGHWEGDTQSTVDGNTQETAMDPDIKAGDRKFFTELDWAALADIGWEVQATDDVGGVPSPVPLPASAWLMLAALAGLGMLGRRRALEPAATA